MDFTGAYRDCVISRNGLDWCKTASEDVIAAEVRAVCACYHMETALPVDLLGTVLGRYCYQLAAVLARVCKNFRLAVHSPTFWTSGVRHAVMNKLAPYALPKEFVLHVARSINPFISLGDEVLGPLGLRHQVEWIFKPSMVVSCKNMTINAVQFAMYMFRSAEVLMFKVKQTATLTARLNLEACAHVGNGVIKSFDTFRALQGQPQFQCTIHTQTGEVRYSTAVARPFEVEQQALRWVCTSKKRARFE